MHRKKFHYLSVQIRWKKVYSKEFDFLPNEIMSHKVSRSNVNFLLMKFCRKKYVETTSIFRTMK